MSTKNHDAIPIPDVEVFARAVGKIAFTCPNCSQEHPLTHIAWRRGDIQCTRCHAKFQIGLGFDLEYYTDAYLMGKWNSYTANRWKPIGTPIEGTKVYGTIEWACRACQHPQKNMMSYNSSVKCESCAGMYYISALIYRLPKVSRLKLRAPLDSLVKGLNHVQVPTEQPTNASPTPQVAGEASTGAGGNS